MTCTFGSVWCSHSLFNTLNTHKLPNIWVKVQDIDDEAGLERSSQRDKKILDGSIAQNWIKVCRRPAPPLHSFNSWWRKGLIAGSNIAKGTRVLVGSRLFTVMNMSSASMMETDIAAQLKSLLKAEQRHVYSLHNNFPGKTPHSGIVMTKALPSGPDSHIRRHLSHHLPH